MIITADAAAGAVLHHANFTNMSTLVVGRQAAEAACTGTSIVGKANNVNLGGDYACLLSKPSFVGWVNPGVGREGRRRQRKDLSIGHHLHSIFSHCGWWGWGLGPCIGSAFANT